MKRRLRTESRPQTVPAKLAQLAADHYLCEQTPLPLPTNLAPELTHQQACYVSILERPGNYLRGQAGYPLPRQRCLGEEIIANTTAALNGRAGRLDLPALSFHLAVLGQLQKINALEHLNPLVFGLYLKSERGKTAFILPARLGIATAEDQIATALREAGVVTNQESYELYRCPVTFYE
jgi:AMMECR1 domain-containing protein